MHVLLTSTRTRSRKRRPDERRDESSEVAPYRDAQHDAHDAEQQRLEEAEANQEWTTEAESVHKAKSAGAAARRPRRCGRR